MPTGQTTPPPAQPLLTPPNFAEYRTANDRLTVLLGQQADTEKQLQRNRLIRFLPIEAENLRAQNVLQKDQVYIPVRLADMNIRREEPQFVSYLTQSRRAAIFEPKEDESLEPLRQPLETFYTKIRRYENWQVPFMRVRDGAATNGYDFVRVSYDSTKACHWSLRQVGYGKLIISSQATTDIQAQESLAEEHEMTDIELRLAVSDMGFNEALVDKALAKPTASGSNQDLKVNKVYEFFYRDSAQAGRVFVGWLLKDQNEWLKAPTPLVMGVRDFTKQPDLTEGLKDPAGLPVPTHPYEAEYEYPYKIYCYLESENPKLADRKGRCDLDFADQEGACAIMSGIVNKTIRGANMFASRAQSANPQDPTQANAIPKYTDVKIKNGYVLDTPTNYSYLPGPNTTEMAAFNTLMGKNANEQSQVDYAANNREDSRKTATEIAAANKQAQELSNVQISSYSLFIAEIENYGWRITRSCILQGLIKTPPLIKLAAQGLWTLKASGDVDVIERAEKLQKMKQDWPVFSQTPLAIPFLKDLITESYPSEAQRYNAILDQAQQQEQQVAQDTELIGALYQVALKLGVDANGQPRPEAQAILQQNPQLVQAVQARLGAGQQQAQPQGRAEGTPR